MIRKHYLKKKNSTKHLGKPVNQQLTILNNETNVQSKLQKRQEREARYLINLNI